MTKKNVSVPAFLEVSDGNYVSTADLLADAERRGKAIANVLKKAEAAELEAEQLRLLASWVRDQAES